MAITVANSGSSEKTTSATTFVYTLLFSPTAGNTLIVAISGNNGAAGTTYSVADSAGGGSYAQDKLLKDASNGQSIGWYRRDNIPSGITTVTITCSVSTFLTIAVLELAGSLSSGSLDVVSTGQTGIGTSATPVSYTPTTGDAAFTTLTHNGGTSPTLTTSASGWAVITKQTSTTGMPICVIGNLSTSGAQNPATTIGASVNWVDAGSSYLVSVATTDTYPVPHQSASALLAM